MMIYFLSFYENNWLYNFLSKYLKNLQLKPNPQIAFVYKPTLYSNSCNAKRRKRSAVHTCVEHRRNIREYEAIVFG